MNAERCGGAEALEHESAFDHKYLFFTCFYYWF
jgi:hypothetical protein